MNRFSSIVLALSLTIGTLTGCSPVGKNEVIAIPKTRSYHRPTCPLVNMARTKVMTVAEAKVDHFKPCPGCKPDTL